STPALARSRAVLAREAAASEIKSVTNQTLLDVDAAYWTMVESALAVQAVRQSLNAAEDMFDATQRLYNSRSANNYDLAQAELTLANTRAREQQAWSDYLRASDSLAFLLDMPASSLIVPSGFSELIALDEAPSPAAADALVEHPDYQSAKALNESAGLDNQAGRQGLRPDLTLEAELQFRQSNQVFGYKSFSDSLSSVFDPDISTQRIGLNYTLPLGQRGLKANSRALEAAHKQSTLQLTATANALQGKLSSAKARLEGARINAGYAAEANRLAELSYEKALEQQRGRQVREYELSGQHARLLEARLAYIAALAEIKRAETALLEAQGVLHEKYAERLTRSNVEQWRLSRLQDSGAFSVFLPGGKDL
ncbi:MAG: TolC family protein, partial [Gammaproteobacteria bacterium]|nr:TolC family protein [Gammaproteobacteria bacterium]